MNKMILKKDFIRRLIRLDCAIRKAISKDSIDYDLLPALWSVFSFLWSGRNVVCNPHKNYDPFNS